LSSRAEPLPAVPSRGEGWAEEWVRLTAFAYRNLIMARRNVFFLFELTFWPGVAMISHGLLTRFLDLTPPMTAFILVGTIALSAVQVCQLDVAYAVLFDIWSKSMKHQFLTPVRIHHLALGSWLVGVGRGVIVWGLMALIGSRAFGFDFVGAGAPRVAMFLLGCFMTALVIGLLVCALVLLFGTRAETSAWAAVNFFVTVINMRAKGMTMMRMPMFVWMSFITQVLLLLAFPVITVALILLMFDRSFGSHFFIPSAGGDPLPQRPSRDERGLDDLGVAGGALLGRQRREQRGIDEHPRGLVVGADVVLRLRQVDPGLAAVGRVHLCDERRRDLDERDATEVRRGQEAGRDGQNQSHAGQRRIFESRKLREERREQAEGDQGEREVGGREDRTRPYRVIEGGQQQSHHRGVDPAQGRLERRPPAQRVPERQRPHDEQERGQEDGDEREAGARPPPGRHVHDRAQVGREGEERPGHRLRRAIAGQELGVRHPAGRHDLGLQQRQNHVTAAEDEGTRPVEGIEDGQRRRRNRLTQEWQHHEQPEEDDERDDGQMAPE